MAATAALSYLGTTSPLYIKTTSYVSPLRMSPCLELVRTSPNAMAANSSAVFNQMEDSLHVCWRFLTWFTLITAHVLTSIIYHSFCARRHEELLLRRLIAPQVLYWWHDLFIMSLRLQTKRFVSTFSLKLFVNSKVNLNANYVLRYEHKVCNTWKVNWKLIGHAGEPVVSGCTEMPEHNLGEWVRWSF